MFTNGPGIFWTKPGSFSQHRPWHVHGQPEVGNPNNTVSAKPHTLAIEDTLRTESNVRQTRMATGTSQDQARAQVRQMVAVLRRPDWAELATMTHELLGDVEHPGELLYPTLAETTTAIAAMIEARAGESGPNTMFVLDVASEEGTVDADAAPPAPRALLRAVLASLEKHPEDARDQLAMACTDPRPSGRLDAVVTGLMCLQSLLDRESGAPGTPRWLTGLERGIRSG